VGELFTGTAFNADITPALCAGSGFFACAAAIGIAAVTAAVTGYELSGGGGHASLPSVPPALLGAQLAQQLARHGFTPQCEVYDRPSPGTHFNPSQLRPASDPRPFPNGRTGQPPNTASGESERKCEAAAVGGCAFHFAHINSGLGAAAIGCAEGSALAGPAAGASFATCFGWAGGVQVPALVPLDYLLLKGCLQEYHACGN